MAIRCVVGLVLVILWMHMCDLHLDPLRNSRLTLARYMVLLPDLAWSLARDPGDHGLDLSLQRRARDVGMAGAGLCVVSAIVVAAFKVDWAAYAFLAEHVAKSLCLGAWTVWAFHANTAIWRLVGLPAARFAAGNVLAAYSPADFWRRWNRPVYRWLLENVYRPLGERGHPRLAVFTTFAISGLLHEYFFVVTFRSATGLVTVFFLLHGLAATATRGFRPTGWLVVPAVAATAAFNILSTLLLLVPIHRQIPIYVNRIPEWMAIWP
jgi:hypothetical protein